MLLYSAYADASLGDPGGRSPAPTALVNKGAPARELYDAIRTVAAGRRLLPQPSAELMEAIAAQVDRSDLAIIRLVLEGEEAGVVADALQLAEEDLSTRVDALIARLKVEVAGR